MCVRWIDGGGWVWNEIFRVKSLSVNKKQFRGLGGRNVIHFIGQMVLLHWQ